MVVIVFILVVVVLMNFIELKIVISKVGNNVIKKLWVILLMIVFWCLLIVLLNIFVVFLVKKFVSIFGKIIVKLNIGKVNMVIIVLIVVVMKFKIIVFGL